jgi:NAD(P)-dependent dehydrogenase (short-subunit alcohol dehydrogenase family)
LTQEKKTVVITGGNAGIGFETAKVLAQRGYQVVITGRDEAKLRQAVSTIQALTHGTIRYLLGDFASFDSVRMLARDLLAEPRLDVLINNVGVARSRRTMTQDGNEMVLQVNHLSPCLLTYLLLDKIKASAPARIVNISSRSHRLVRDPGFDDFQFARSFSVARSYARTKLYNILFSRELARRLAGTGVTVNALHPGVIVSRIGLDGDLHGLMNILMHLRQPFKSPASLGAKVVCFVATAAEIDGVSGQYFSTHLRPTQPTRLARDDEAARHLWDISYHLLALPDAVHP